MPGTLLALRRALDTEFDGPYQRVNLILCVLDAGFLEERTEMCEIELGNDLVLLRCSRESVTVVIKIVDSCGQQVLNVFVLGLKFR